MPEPERPPPTQNAPRWSLRMRLTIWVVAIFALIQWATGGVFWLYQRAAIQSVLGTVLLERGRDLADQVRPMLPVIDELETLALGRELRTVEFGSFYFDVLDWDGKSVLVAPPDSERWADLPLAEAFETREPRIVSRSSVGGGGGDAAPWETHAIIMPVVDSMDRQYAVVLTASDDFAQRQMALLARVLVLAGIIGPIAAAVAGWFIAGIAVAPFDRLRVFARQLGPESIEEELSFESDNTEVERLASELKRARERMHGAFAAQERFLSHVSHELKTPIAVMAVDAQTIDTSGFPPEAREFIDRMSEEMLRLGQLVESFLTLTRVQDGKAVPHERVTPVNDLIMDSIDHCQLMAEQQGVRLVPTLLDGDDPMGAGVVGDPRLLCTLFENLIRNAIRFSPIDGRVLIEPGLDGGAAVVRVSDEGPGIPPERLETIFDRFAQLEHGQRTGRGHGLGLAIAQGIAELHGGRVCATNREEGGACFVVRLPLAGEGEPGDAPGPGSGGSPAE